MKNIAISEGLFARLQSHAAPLVDTVEDVIRRAVDALDAESSGSVESDSDEKEFNPYSPPDVGRTKIIKAVVDGQVLTPGESYWVLILARVISNASRGGGLKAEEVSKFYSGTTLGLVSGQGQYPVEDVGVTLQGRSADVCLRAICSLVEVYGIEVDIHFQWYKIDKAAFPGQMGRLVIRRR